VSEDERWVLPEQFLRDKVKLSLTTGTDAGERIARTAELIAEAAADSRFTGVPMRVRFFDFAQASREGGWPGYEGAREKPAEEERPDWEVFLHDRAREIFRIEPQLAVMIMAMALHHEADRTWDKKSWQCNSCLDGGYDPENVTAPCDTVLILLSLWEKHPLYRNKWNPKSLVPRDKIAGLLMKGTP